jgi:hypothetical protein
MNERLKNIMLAHGLHKHISEDCQHRMEMLAKLIVEECCEVVRYVDAVEIKKHFGIE